MSTDQLGLGHICDAPGRDGGPIVALAVIWPLRGWMFVICPCRGPKSTLFGGGLLPPGFTHCKVALPPEEVKKAHVAMFASPPALKLLVRLKLEFLVILYVLLQCCMHTIFTSIIKKVNLKKSNCPTFHFV